LDRALQEQKSFLNDFEHADLQHLDAINELFKDAKALGRKVVAHATQYPFFSNPC
jgi:hypothetical protein